MYWLVGIYLPGGSVVEPGQGRAGPGREAAGLWIFRGLSKSVHVL